MINEIIDGISVAINTEFGDDYEIYTETVEQGLEEPCFSILCINPSIEQFLGKRYFKTNQFCIHYFPGSKERRSECNSVIERLEDCLETITVGGDLIRGTSLHSEISDDVLSFFVNYDLFVYKPKEAEENMEEAEYNTDVKG
jgi:hypothetical protein